MEVLQYIDAGEVKRLLELLQPQERVETRAPNEPKEYVRQVPAPVIITPFRSPKRRRSVARNYEVVDYAAEHYHRRGTWTAAMVASALANRNTRDAEQWLRENHSEFANRSIDWTWLADKRNYIRFH